MFRKVMGMGTAMLTDWVEAKMSHITNFFLEVRTQPLGIRWAAQVNFEDRILDAQAVPFQDARYPDLL